MKIFRFSEFNKVEEAFMQENSLRQLKKLRSLTKGTDIGDRISDMSKQGANIGYIHNPVDTGITTQQSNDKHNKKFISGWNFKRLMSPFTGETQDRKS